MTTLNQKIIEAIAEANKVNKQAERVNARREGIYTILTREAAANGATVFEKACDEVFDAIRGNVDGVAAETGCKPGKKEGTYVVPGAAMSAKSVLLGAFEYGVTMLDDETDGPRAFSAIRTDVKAARDLEALENASEEDQIRAALLAQIAGMVERLEAGDVDAMQAAAMAELSISLDTWEDDYAALSGEEGKQEEKKAA